MFSIAHWLAPPRPAAYPPPCLQALYPWRRVLREMFHHDSQLGQLYCLRGTDPVMVRAHLVGAACSAPGAALGLPAPAAPRQAG